MRWKPTTIAFFFFFQRTDGDAQQRGGGSMKDPEVLGAETRRALLLAKGKKKDGERGRISVQEFKTEKRR